MADIIQASPDALIQQAGILRKSAETVSTMISEMQSEMKSMSGAWTGQAGEMFVQKYDALAKKLQLRYETILDYAKFLEDAAEGFKQAESKNVTAQQSLV